MTHLRVYRWCEWWFRVRGWGLAMRDHRRIKPLFSERYAGQYGVAPARLLHVGPFCFTILRPYE